MPSTPSEASEREEEEEGIGVPAEILTSPQQQQQDTNDDKDRSNVGVVPPPVAAVASSSSSSRMRFAEHRVWPEPFLEAVVLRVANDAARDHGRLAAAPAVATLFQLLNAGVFFLQRFGGYKYIRACLRKSVTCVCSTWRAVSQSELLWQNLTHEIWLTGNELHHLPTWQLEYAHRHRTASNFRTSNVLHTSIVIDDAALPPPTSCCRIALSERHLAVGFSDGSVRLFELPSSQHLATFGPHVARNLLGPFSWSISGLILESCPSHRLVFASQDGDIHVASTRDYSLGSRRARAGHVVEDGALVDFAACGRWWVGLFAGVPGRSLRVWDGGTEELVYVGGTLTDVDSVLGWRMLTEMSGQVGRVRAANPSGSALVACTASSLQVMDMEEDIGAVSVECELHHGAIIDAVDACDGRVFVVDSRGVATVLHEPSMDEVCRFSVAAGRAGGGADATRGPAVMSACLNWGYAVVCQAGRVRVWDASTGEFLYQMQDRVGRSVGVVVAASDRYLVLGEKGLLHLWDFGFL